MKKRVKQHGIDAKDLMKLINPKKIKILNILKKEKEINQMQLQRKLKLSYRQTLRYIDSLKKADLIRRRKTKKVAGNPVYISLKKKTKRKSSKK